MMATSFDVALINIGIRSCEADMARLRKLFSFLRLLLTLLILLHTQKVFSFLLHALTFPLFFWRFFSRSTLVSCHKIIPPFSLLVSLLLLLLIYLVFPPSTENKKEEKNLLQFCKTQFMVLMFK